jgi:hypothetical protein
LVLALAAFVLAKVYGVLLEETYGNVPGKTASHLHLE